jgi:hypothetical protein
MNTPSTVARHTHGQFCWVDLVTHDLPAAARFYADLFGWTVEEQDTDGGPSYAMFAREGDVVAGIGAMSDAMRESGVPPMWNSYIHVDDVHAMTEAAENLGAPIITPPMQVMDAGWLAYIEAPTGGAVGLWQDGSHHGAERVNVPGAFCWNELNTRDMDGAKAFFHQLLGWTYEDNAESPTPYAIIHNDGRPNGGILEMNDEWGGMSPHWSVYFTVTDIDADVEQLRALGGQLHHGPFDTSVGRMAVVADPQSAIFHLIALSDPVT